MSTQSKLILLSGCSALVWQLCAAELARAQTPPPPAQQQPGEPQAQQPTAPPAPPAPPQDTPPAPPAPTAQTPLPPVQVTAPRQRARQVRQARPAPVRAPAPVVRRAPPRPAPVATPPAPPPAPRAPPAAGVPFTPLTGITAAQIERSTSPNFGDLFFTTPGATASTFAPGASRPILRGLQDFRVRLQENGVGSGDVSDYGQDHAVPIDPLTIQSIEIMRGPSALRFGSQAVGGIVEVTNNRIPTAAPVGGIAAELKSAGTTVNNGWEQAILLDAGARNAAIHADVFGRRGDAYRIPSYPYLYPPDPAPVVNGRQPNSSFHSEGASVGGSWLFDSGYAGVAVSRFTSDYHVPGIEAAERRTHIQMEQTKVTSKGEFRSGSAAVAAVRYWAGWTDYKHHEIGLNDIGFDQIAATFLNRQTEGKIEAELMPLITPVGALTSFFGAQASHQQLDTAGEAIVFPARTRIAAGYWFGEFQHTATLRTQWAGRVERVDIDGTAVDFPPGFLPPPDDPAGTPSARAFTPKSLSFSAIQELPSYLVASLTLQRIERAPRALELFAKGPHDATQTFDIGNANLTIETAKTAEIGLKRVLGDFRFDGKAYYTRYDNFIFQQPTGIFCGEEFASCGIETELLQTYIAQRDAIFRGAELAWQWDVVPVGYGVFGLDGQYDTVRATFTDGSNVPRIPPQRVGGGAYWRNDNWFVRMGLVHAFPQYDLAQFETPTAGYNLLKAEIVHRRFWRDSPWGPVEVTSGLVANNLLDVDIRNHAQFHKDEVLQPGRSFKFYVNTKFGVDRPGAPPGPFKAPNGAPMLYKAPVMAAWNWSGLYLGGNAGTSSGRIITDATFNDATTADPLFGGNRSDKFKGAFGGVQAGYNWQNGALVAGIEGDFQGARKRGRSTTFACASAQCNPTMEEFALDAPVTATVRHKVGWFGTLRGRLGVTPTPESLLYATGGLAIARIKTSGTIDGFRLTRTEGFEEGFEEGTAIELDENGNEIEVPVQIPIQVPVVTGSAYPASTQFANEVTKAGWTVGAGIEARLGGNWTGKVEYLYMDFGGVTTVATSTVNATPLTLTLNSRVTDNIVRVGLNYKFGN